MDPDVREQVARTIENSTPTERICVLQGSLDDPLLTSLEKSLFGRPGWTTKRLEHRFVSETVAWLRAQFGSDIADLKTPGKLFLVVYRAPETNPLGTLPLWEKYHDWDDIPLDPRVRFFPVLPAGCSVPPDLWWEAFTRGACDILSEVEDASVQADRLDAATRLVFGTTHAIPERYLHVRAKFLDINPYYWTALKHNDESKSTPPLPGNIASQLLHETLRPLLSVSLAWQYNAIVDRMLIEPDSERFRPAMDESREPPGACIVLGSPEFLTIETTTTLKRVASTLETLPTALTGTETPVLIYSQGVSLRDLGRAMRDIKDGGNAVPNSLILLVEDSPDGLTPETFRDLARMSLPLFRATASTCGSKYMTKEERWTWVQEWAQEGLLCHLPGALCTLETASEGLLDDYPGSGAIPNTEIHQKTWIGLLRELTRLLLLARVAQRFLQTPGGTDT